MLLEQFRNMETSSPQIVRAHPSTVPSISLEFSSNVSPFIRPRISYAFRIFAAIYGHRVVERSRNGGLRCIYGTKGASTSQSGALHIPALYRDIRFQSGWKHFLTRYRYAGEEFQLAFGIDASSGNPDWLGELFLWLSGSYEVDIAKRDRVGRIPYSQMVFSRNGVSPLKPHASMLMAWMENVLLYGNSSEELPRALSPIPGTQHLVISSHDIDYYFTDRASAFRRLMKNLAIAAVTYRSWSYFLSNLKMILHLIRGNPPGDFLPALLDSGEEHDFRSTLFVVARRGHKRDPNYALDRISPLLSAGAKKGFPTGVHGSYRSLMEDRTLRSEVQAIGRETGTKPVASRQHWLRFGDFQKLLAEISRAGLLCDSTLGFPDMVGFRNGASFAFPPYDFANARPHQFLEIPLVLMDGGLHTASRRLKKNSQELADEVLNESRKYGWGGVSVLWHNPIEPLSVPSEINEVFWNGVRKQKGFREKWVSVDQFLRSCLQRYQQAGLLEGVSFDG